VLLPVRDGGAWLGELLPRLASQAVDAVVEIVGIDCGSADDSIEKLQHHDARIVALETVSPTAAPLGSAVSYARGDVLVLLGQGVVPADDDWLAALLAAFDDERVAGVCSRLLPVAGSDPLFSSELLADPVSRPEPVRLTDETLGEPSNGGLRFHGLATAFRKEALGRVALGAANEAEVERWAKAALVAGLELRLEPAAVARRRPPTHLELLRAALAPGSPGSGNGSGRHEEFAAAMGAIRDDWRCLEQDLRVEGEELELARLDAALRRTLEAVGRSLAASRESSKATRSRLWIEDAQAGTLAAGSGTGRS
jgi:hypothetical protein